MKLTGLTPKTVGDILEVLLKRRVEMNPYGFELINDLKTRARLQRGSGIAGRGHVWMLVRLPDGGAIRSGLATKQQLVRAVLDFMGDAVPAKKIAANMERLRDRSASEHPSYEAFCRLARKHDYGAEALNAAWEAFKTGWDRLADDYVVDNAARGVLMTACDRTNAYETVACALAVLERVKARDLGHISVRLREVISRLVDIQCDLQAGGRVYRKLEEET